MKDHIELEPRAAEPGYEPPAIVVLGSVERLTAGKSDDSSLSIPSDSLLKRDIAILGDPLGSLRGIRTR